MTRGSRQAAAKADSKLADEEGQPDEEPEPAEVEDERRGVAMLVAAALLFSLMSVQVKLAGGELPVELLILARCVVTLVLSYGWLRARGIPLWGHDKAGLVLRGLFGLGGLACFFTAVTLLPLAEVTVIHYLNPMLTAALAAVVLGERVGWRLGVAIPLALSGTLLVARPGVVYGGASLPLAGVLAALGGAVFSACAYVMVRRLRSESPHVIVFYFPLVAVPFTLPFAWRAWIWPSPRGWLLMLTIGVTVQVAQVLLTRGLALVPAGKGTTIGYVQILFAALWGWLWFGERLHLHTLAGAALVVASLLALLRRGQRQPAT